MHFFNRALLHFMGTVLDGVITCVGGKCVELALRKACYVIKVLAPLRLYSEKWIKIFRRVDFFETLLYSNNRIFGQSMYLSIFR